eukprot:NODE_6_length_48303_cov_0.387022.p15 type:complete len:232 gc:universal NODE_6_length_48303_cov_0.387022:11163-10468(-)
MSGFPDISSFTKSATMLVKMDDFKSLLSTVDTVANTNVTVLSKTDLPLKDCFIKLSQDASNLQIESFMNELNTILNQDIIINDARAAIKNTQDTKTKGNFTLNSVSIGAIILCFFVLIISFESNVKDNSWEYGVLRSLGFTKAILVRVYVYESMSIVLSSAALGTLIGSLTGVFFCLQSNVFLELPWAFSFLLEFYIVIILLACILAVSGSILPSLELNKKTISATIKGTK